MTKAPFGLEPLMTNSPKSWHSGTKRCQSQTRAVLCVSDQQLQLLEILVCLASCEIHTNRCTTQMAETRNNFLIH